VSNGLSPLVTALISIGCLIPAVVFHEVAHGWVANKLGDPTARAMGRLTLNPIKHIDPFGTVILPLLLASMGLPVFGYAKPVPYNPRNFVAALEPPVSREQAVRTLKRGELLTGLAGPATNFVLALIGAAITWGAVALQDVSPVLAGAIYIVFSFFVIINLVLMFFNLLPIPPLDGSSIIAVFLPGKWLHHYYGLQRYGMVILFGILLLGPRLLGFDPIGWYFDKTALSIAGILLP